MNYPRLLLAALRLCLCFSHGDSWRKVGCCRRTSRLQRTTRCDLSEIGFGQWKPKQPMGCETRNAGRCQYARSRQQKNRQSVVPQLPDLEFEAAPQTAEREERLPARYLESASRADSAPESRL
jgi:hypothetical protein